MRAIAAAVMALAFTTNAHAEDKSKAREALEAAGYTNIRNEEPSLAGCSKDDSRLTSRTFKARSPGGVDGPVRVCCGLLFRGCVIRTGGLIL